MRLNLVALGLLLLATGGTSSWAAQDTAPTAVGITQAEFAGRLIKALHWEAGLPAKPKDRDLLVILLGKRYFKFEAEEYYNARTDNVSVRRYNLFGPFSGNGWVSGIAQPTTVHLGIFLPIEGNYTLTVSGKGDGQQLTIADKTLTVNCGGAFHDVEAGTVSLKAGAHDISVVLPPEGALDYLVLSAPPLPPLEPVNGWNFKEQLTLADYARIGLTLLKLESSLPADSTRKPFTVAVADAVEVSPPATKSTVSYFGSYQAKQWVRAGFKNATLQVPVTVDQDGVYGVRVRYMGVKFSATLDDTPIAQTGKPYFDWISLGDRQLSKGSHNLTLDLAPSDGVDVVELTPKKSSPSDYLALLGAQGDPRKVVTATEADALIASLVQRFKGRQ
jgi:hypothetical protein